MVNLEISLEGGKVYRIRNLAFNSPKEWIKGILMPQGNQVLWCEILAGEFVQVAQIQSIREMSDEEVEALRQSQLAEQQTDSSGPEEAETENIEIPAE